MRLYHGSNIAIDNINLAMCRPYKDFGQGFYLTDIEEQAKKMAARVARIYGKTPIINVYEIDDDFKALDNLRIKDFGIQTTEEWARFVMNNRSRDFIDVNDILCNKDNKYDIVLRGNYAKFSQDEELKKFIINTKNRVLVEASPYDSVWGIKMSSKDNNIENPHYWRGENLLGFALMEVRDKLIEESI